ncbi:phosphotransferase enzyme family protein [Alloiococcus sp. CFN-8]|uniref:phosphotransferase enzyme family protein n=1 Tax=Alloiococcus sp. CFN-8 TaxID=3416081 RepID=UPI003CF59137
MNNNYELGTIAANFSFDGDIISIEGYGDGHINDTYLVKTKASEGKELKYILQRINHNIFKDPEGLMNNLSLVTSYLKEKIIERGGDEYRETLNLVPTNEGKSFYVSPEGDYWRSYIFIEGARTYLIVENTMDFYNTGKALGRFQKLLEDFPAEKLCETIKDFHNTEKRFKDFTTAVKENKAQRLHLAEKEVEAFLALEKETKVLNSLLEDGKLPLRVTHNDTKFNNVMIDDVTREGICIIDLDTVMPGLSLYDFGDAIRSGATTGEEDEEDLSKVALDMELFEAFVKGYMEEAREFLNEEEIAFLPFSAMIMTYECGIRFLADFLEGDVYFKVHKENHNLFRARTQLKMVQDIQGKMNLMTEIINKYRFN